MGEAVAAWLRARAIRYADLTGPSADSTLAAIRTAIDTDGIDCLIAVGGDGMVNLAVNALAESGIPLVIIPAGTGNDMASAVGVPLGRPRAALELIFTGVTRTVDAVRVSSPDTAPRWFIGVLAGGFDAIVNERANGIRWPRGSAKYTLAAMRELPVFRPIPYRITIDGTEHDGAAMLVAVANGTSYGGGMKVVPTAVVDDGLLDVLILSELSIPTFIRVFPTVFSGRHITHPAVRIVRGRTVDLDADGVIAYADGERLGPLPLSMEIVPAAMQILGAPVHVP